jgi:phi13 family phage major tail protein
MAKIGLKGIRFAELTETETYGTPQSAGKAVSASVSVNNNDAKLYADDALAESDTTFSSAGVSLTVDDDNNVVLAKLLGHTISGQTGEIVRNANDTAPYFGLGRIITKVVNNVRQYKVEFLCKVKFGEPSQEENTKGDSVEFGTTTIEGTASVLSTGVWSKSETFATEQLATAYLDACFGVEAENE